MGKKKDQAGKPSRMESGGSPCQEVDRLIAKGWFKDAIKQAKICQRDHPSPEHHQLLERTHLLRAQELRNGGMVTAAREVASHLLNLGVTDPDLNEPVADLLLAVGMAGEAVRFQSRLGSPEALERFQRQAADQAVLHPDRVGAIEPAILDAARRVRSALEALTTSDEARALDGFRDVARSSPFADWRVFARGLAASRRGDDAEARSHWDRLDPTRTAARIAQAMLAVNAGAAADRRLDHRRETGSPGALGLRGVAARTARGSDEMRGERRLDRRDPAVDFAPAGAPSARSGPGRAVDPGTDLAADARKRRVATGVRVTT